MKKQNNRTKEILSAQQVVVEAVAEIAAAAENAQPAEVQKPRTRKAVEFRFPTELMEHETEKARLIVFETAEGEEVRYWLSKALAYFTPDADEPQTTICRLPAWLYFKTGLNRHFTILRWAQVAA